MAERKPLSPALNTPFFSRSLNQAESVFKLPYPATLGIVVIVPLYVLGLVLALAEGDLSRFFAYYILPAGLFGTYYIGTATEWGIRRCRRVGIEAEGSFAPGYMDLFRRRWNLASDDLWALTIIGPMVGLTVTYALVVRLSSASLIPIPRISDWIVLGPFPLFLYVLIVLAVFGYIGGLSVYVTLVFLAFAWDLRRIPVDRYGLLTREAAPHEVAVTAFYISLIWFGALTIGTTVFYTNVNYATLVPYSLIALAGFAMFLLPQWAIHRSILLGKAEMVRELRSHLPANRRSLEALYADNKGPAVVSHIHTVSDLEDWPIDVRHVLTEGLAAMFPLIGTLVASSLGVRFL